ncbi:hypothetical protein SEA_REFUGE_77 [Mycobacterium phage Refuge]|uniref:MazG-like nucleotide pyrophosphohydrolase n=1 Tax=Mycobacterium phage Refuge TaxID=2517967 RepID=A0A482JEN9_9CAUD|nr:hypothetical protein KIV61_gp26 [Mycobacterium phage Refuge]QBP31095.1 hypothetical protein SEA_REFUGE_77 [Mycobacterium phage Refuge]
MIEDTFDLHKVAASPKTGREPGDNSYNVSWAAVAASAYQKVIGGDFENIIPDLLGDLMHLADAMGVDFEEALNKAEFNYDAEVNGE